MNANGAPQCQGPKPPSWLLWISGTLALLIGASYMVATTFPQLVSADEFKFSLTVALANAIAAVVLPVLLYVAFTERNGNTCPIQSATANLMAMLLGFLAGWALAVFWVPFDGIDGKVYGQIGSTVALVFSGYLFSKVDKLIGVGLGGNGTAPTRYFLMLAMLFVCSLIFTALVLITNRVEYLQDQAQKHPDKVVAKAKADVEMALAALKNAQDAKAVACAARRAGSAVTATGIC